ncbi:SH3 domain-containing protein, partial [Acinetobacter soli]
TQDVNAASKTATVDTSVLNVRQSSSTSSTIVGKLTKGNKVSVLIFILMDGDKDSRFQVGRLTQIQVIGDGVRLLDLTCRCGCCCSHL